MTSDKPVSIYFVALVMAVTQGLSAAEQSQIETHYLESKSIKFAVIGDYGLAGPDTESVSNTLKSYNPDFIITTGDNNYEDGAADTIDENVGQYFHEFIYPYKGDEKKYGKGSPEQNRFFPSIGNHDWNKEKGVEPYLQYFNLPKNSDSSDAKSRYYQYVWGPAQFFAIDSNSEEPDGIAKTSKQALWLKKALAVSQQNHQIKFRIVYLHHPPYATSSGHSQSPQLRWPFKEWGADLVLSGHSHVYERLLFENLPYIIVGFSGGPLHSFAKTTSKYSVKKFNKEHGFLLVNIDQNKMTIQAVGASRKIIDEAVFEKPARKTLSSEYERGKK